MAVNARDKGQRAERQAIATLQPVVDKVYREFEMEPPALERNLMQSMKGGYDVVGLDWMALEIKHQETLKVGDWWNQAVRQAGESRIPVLMYKSNRVKWRVMLLGLLPAGERRIKCPCDVELDSFLLWLEYRIRSELMQMGK